jgi:hypothetical protein
MAHRPPACKAQTGRRQRFPPSAAPADKLRLVEGALFACQNRGVRAPVRKPHPADIYLLLCMFNGFAFARPFCAGIKVILMGVGFTLG